MEGIDSEATTWTRLGPLTGVGYFVLVVIGTVVIGQYAYLPDVDEISTFFADNATRVQVGAAIVLPSSALLIWFAGSLRSHLRLAEGATGRLSAVAFGGAVAAAALSAVSYAGIAAAGARAGTDTGLEPAVAAAMYDLYGSIFGSAVPVAMAAMVGATALVCARRQLFGSAFVWVSAVIAVGCLIMPIAFAFVGLAALWVPAVGIMLYQRQPAPAPATTD